MYRTWNELNAEEETPDFLEQLAEDLRRRARRQERARYVPDCDTSEPIPRLPDEDDAGIWRVRVPVSAKITDHHCL